jgi:hypothetical protein
MNRQCRLVTARKHLGQQLIRDLAGDADGPAWFIAHCGSLHDLPSPAVLALRDPLSVRSALLELLISRV